MAEGDKHKKVKGKLIMRPEKDGKGEEDGERRGQKKDDDPDDDARMSSLWINMMIQESISAIHSQISALHSDPKDDMTDFRQKIWDDIRNDLTEFKEEINRKLNEVTKSL